ncbi:kinase-like domain-containing protein [Flagelloscypha sp. PMI_526]|nr:kinase-like domain-containing protein [Flagelloscypha sp. PMI_526]
MKRSRTSRRGYALRGKRVCPSLLFNYLHCALGKLGKTVLVNPSIMGHYLHHELPQLDQGHDRYPALIKQNLLKWRAKCEPFELSPQFMEDLNMIFAVLQKDATLVLTGFISLHEPLCRLYLARREDPLFLNFLRTSLPSHSRISVASSRPSDNGSESIVALAVITPTGQTIWDTTSGSPTSSTFLFKGLDGNLWDLLNRRDDRYILSRIGSSSTSLALCAMDVFQWGADYAKDIAHRKKCIRLLHRLSKMHRSVPPSLRLPHIIVDGKNRIGGGGFSDVYRGTLKGIDVSVKVLRLFMEEGARKRIIKDFCRETLVWRQLSHPNILSFWGFNDKLFAPSFCLVSPLLSNGNVMSYLGRNPEMDKSSILTNIASGMHYLHSLKPDVVHGDIRGVRIHCWLVRPLTN